MIGQKIYCICWDRTGYERIGQDEIVQKWIDLAGKDGRKTTGRGQGMKG
jgi:hypothetical protein